MADPATGNVQRSFGVYSSTFVIPRLHLTQSGDRLLAGGPGSGYVLYDVTSGSVLDSFNLEAQGASVRNARFAGGEDRILFASRTPTLLGIAADDTLLKIADQGQTDDADMSPTGEYIATLSLFKQVRLWNAKTGALVKELGTQGLPGYSLIFSPDGRFVLSSSLDHSVRIWPVPTISAVETAPRATVGDVPLAAYPDPASDQIVAHYSMSASGAMHLALLNSLGVQVLSVEHAAEEAGTHQAVLDTRALPSGVYFLRLRASGHETTRTVRVQH
ncbi:MAG TPA: T9SS type A sorting domain-containing protein [Candidatus Paceibacterota bacterium]|nr:T9SS type A sorting domain-containing protein [Candidatus Paceibacterota bacterium]